MWHVANVPSPLKAFLSDLCEVSDFHEQLQLEEYIALSRKDIAIEVSTAEIHTLQSLLLKYRMDMVRDVSSSSSYPVS